MKSYFEKKNDLYKKFEEPYERVTRSIQFSIEDAKEASALYTKQLWKAVKASCKYTDISDNPCAFSEAPAEGIFSVYGHVIEVSEKLTVDNAVRLTTQVVLKDLLQSLNNLQNLLKKL